MAFNSATTNISVTAFLTAAGRKKLFDSLETVNEPFITKFALGDSDANYAGIDAGFGTLAAGAVPEAGEQKPRIRSFALAEGSFKPSVAHIIIDGRYGGSEGHYAQFPIGSNIPDVRTYKIETEWPKKARYAEEHTMSFQLANSNAGVLGAIAVANAFEITFVNNILTVTFKGGMDLTILQNMIGPDDETNNGWTMDFRIEGQESSAVTILSIDFVQ